MLTDTIYTYLLYYFLISPFSKVVLINWQLIWAGIPCQESLVRRITRWTIPLDALHIAALIVAMISVGPYTLSCHLFGFSNIQVSYSWFLVSTLSFSIFLLSLVNYFSCTYLHKDQYFHKFFTLFYLFKLAIVLLNVSDTTRFLFMGWELLGLSSVLLIGFYEHRIEPIKNAIRILFIYKVADIFLFTAFLVAMLFHAETFSQFHLIQDPGAQALIYGFIFIACLIKSGILPWQWLPRAMEGPTPSSSIFYGALATHIPLMMLAKIWPSSLYAPHPLACVGILVCLISAIFSNGLAKQSSDAKGSLAYAITTQLALIYIEVLLGLKVLAMIHALSHGLFRTFDLLKTPSIIHTTLKIELNRNQIKSLQSKPTGPINQFLYALTLKKYGLQPIFFGFIDYFLGLKTQERSQKHLLRFSLISLFVAVVISILSLKMLHETLYIWDELIVIAALCCTFSAFHNLKKTAWFLLLICGSMGLLYLSLLGHIFEKIAAFEWLILIVACISLIAGFQKHKDSSHLHYSKREGLLILILGLGIVGIPGLAGHFLWENMVHLVAFISPHLVLSSFFVMSLNTVLFIMFYYQYLMRPHL